MTRFTRLFSFAFLLMNLVLTFWARPGMSGTKPLPGFHTGPYLQLSIGARKATFDHNLVDNTPIGHTYEPSFGYIFGWNITDPVAFEMQGDYSTAGSQNSQEHLINTRLGAKFSFAFKGLQSTQRSLLPFLGVHGIVQTNILPGASTSSDARVNQWGIGTGFSTGLDFLFYKNTAYLSARFVGDILHRESVSQTIGGTLTPVYAGAWNFDCSSKLAIGVHF